MSDAPETATAAADPVSLIGLIEELIEPQAPPPVPMTPQTAGWAVLGVALAVLAAVAVWRWIAHRRANAYRRAALAELAQAGSDAGRIAVILRRTALSAFPRAQVAGLTGADWVDFLNASGGAFDAETAEALMRAPYRRDPVAAPDLRDAAAGWIRHHRRPEPPAKRRARAFKVAS